MRIDETRLTIEEIEVLANAHEVVPSINVRYDSHVIYLQKGMVHMVNQDGWQHRLVSRIIAINVEAQCIRYRLIEGTAPAGVDMEYDMDAVDFIRKFVWDARVHAFRS